MNFNGKNIHVVGVSGAEGSAVALFLAPRIGNGTLTLHDLSSKDEFKEHFFSFHDAYSQKEKEELYRQLISLRARYCFGNEYLTDISNADMIFVPQAWFRYEENDSLKKYEDTFSNIIALYLEYAKCPVIGITGTAGKSTTSALTYKMIRESGRNVLLSGNERHVRQCLDEVTAMTKNDALVLEISHRQLMLDLKKSPHTAVITNISPNHIDDAGTFESYIEIKKSITKYQDESDIFITNFDNKVTRNIVPESVRYFFSTSKKQRRGAYIDDGIIVVAENGVKKEICSVGDISLQGTYNIQNMLAATLAAYTFGADVKSIASSIKAFTPLEARLEKIRKLNGVIYINDGKSSNPEAVVGALEALERPVILITGGTRKVPIEGEYEKLSKGIIAGTVRDVILIGKNKDIIARVLRSIASSDDIHISMAETLEEAVQNAYARAKKGDVVLLSPGAESFDMFKDYRERIKVFNNAVNSLPS